MAGEECFSLVFFWHVNLPVNVERVQLFEDANITMSIDKFVHAGERVRFEESIYSRCRIPIPVSYLKPFLCIPYINYCAHDGKGTSEPFVGDVATL